MKNRSFIITGVLLLWLIIGCTADKKPLNLAHADSIRMRQLTDSIIAGIPSGDTLHRNSALFLIENLRYHYYLYGSVTELYTDVIFRHSNDRDNLEKKLRALKATNLPPTDSIFDAEVLTATYLQSHISKSLLTFKNAAWRSQIPFDVFQEYILPYRIYDEAASTWQWNAHYFRQSLADSLNLAKDIHKAAAIVHSRLVKSKKPHFSILFGAKSLQIPPVSLQAIDLLPTGSCHELSLYGQAMLRSYGIPTTTDVVPHYVNVNSGHEWSSIIIDSLNFIPFDIANDQLGRYKNDRFRMSKVYRRTFSPDSSSFRIKYGKKNYLPAVFTDPFFQDVTKLYLKTRDLKIPVNININQDAAFLAVFGAPDWVPIDYGTINNKTVEFKNIGCSNGVHMPAIITKNGYLPIGPAFILREDGTIEELTPDSAHLESIKVTRKFPIELFQANKHHIKMIGGTFKGANREDLTDAEVLFTVTESPGDGYNDVRIQNFKKWHYLLYEAPPGSHGNVAEIEFYTDSERALKGTVIGTSGSWQNTSSKTRESAFDKDPLTFFDSAHPDNNWVGLELKEPKQITKIKYLARGDMNGIYPENEYELFYWNNRWISLGRQTARESFLIYNNVPRNALLWLRNLTKGKEERIFTWQNGKQVWW